MKKYKNTCWIYYAFGAILPAVIVLVVQTKRRHTMHGVQRAGAYVDNSIKTAAEQIHNVLETVHEIGSSGFASKIGKNIDEAIKDMKVSLDTVSYLLHKSKNP